MRSGKQEWCEVAFVAHCGKGFPQSGGDALVPDFEKLNNRPLPAFLAKLLCGIIVGGGRLTNQAASRSVCFGIIWLSYKSTTGKQRS